VSELGLVRGESIGYIDQPTQGKVSSPCCPTLEQELSPRCCGDIQ
jgi:hypothetical protein